MLLGRSFTNGQSLGLIAFGGIFWGAAAMKIRYFPQIFYSNPIRQAGAFVVAFPATYSMMRLSESLLDLRVDQRLVSTSVMCAAALFLDGIAFMWFPDLYENPSLSQIKSPLAIQYSRQGAAWILWGVGAALTIALATTMN